jgi:hypothetical protein
MTIFVPVSEYFMLLIMTKFRDILSLYMNLKNSKENENIYTSNGSTRF